MSSMYNYKDTPKIKKCQFLYRIAYKTTHKMRYPNNQVILDTYTIRSFSLEGTILANYIIEQKPCIPRG